MDSIVLPTQWNTYRTNIDGIELEWNDVNRLAIYSHLQVSEIRGDPSEWLDKSFDDRYTLQDFFNNHEKSRSKDWFRTKSLLDGFVPSSMLDIGSGYGFNALMWAKTNPDITIDLIDGDDKFDSNIIDHSKHIRTLNNDYPTYNDWNILHDAIEINNIESNIKTLDVNGFTVEDNKYDYITSQWSCGWHYSIEHYMQVIINSLKPGGRLVLDIADKREADKITQHLGQPHFNVDKWSNLNRFRYIWIN